MRTNYLYSTFTGNTAMVLFLYGKSQVANVVHYIRSQEIHHRKQTFLDKYR